jgi:hypothetical protein
MDVNGERADAKGELAVSWASLAAPWVKYAVVVDGRVMSVIRYKRPASISLAAGRYEVFLRHRRSTSRLVAVDVQEGSRTVLFGAARTMPRGLTPRQAWRWSKENAIWLGNEPTAPKPVEAFSMRRLGSAVGSTAFFGYIAAGNVSQGRILWLVLATLLAMGGFAGVVRQLLILRRAKRTSS